MKNIVYFLALVILCSIHAQSQNKLAMLYSSAGMEYGKASAIDYDSNYINGSLFQNTINVNPKGVTNLTAPGVSTQMALVKYRSNGDLLWAKHIGGVTTSEAPHGIACDSNNNIYVTGYFGSTTQNGAQNADFNPNGGGTISTHGNEDCFVAKYDKNGNYIWAFGLGNTNANTQERAWDISVDRSGNSYVVGGIHGSINFNPLGSPMVYSLTDTLAGVFMAKYNTNGICQWVVLINTQCTSVFNECYATCDLDKQGNIFLAGNFRGSNVNFNPNGTQSNLNSTGNTDIFFAKYLTSSGSLVWVKKVGTLASEIVSPGALRCDSKGNIYFTGRLLGTNSVDFDPSANVMNVTNSGLYLISYNTDGNLRYATGMNSGGGDGGHRVSFDNSDNVIIAGWMNNSATFGTIIKTANSSTADVFLAKYSNDLSNCFWAINFGGNNSSANSICAGLSVDLNGNSWITGQLYGTNANINPLDKNEILSSIGQNDCFAIKYNSDGKIWVQDSTLNPISYNLTLIANPNIGGSVSGAGIYSKDTTVAIQARVNAGYRFLNWTDESSTISSDSVYNLKITKNMTLAANFEKINAVKYNISTQANPSNGGSIQGGGIYDNGDSVNLKAQANAGYKFQNWTENDSVISLDSNYNFVVTRDRNFNANFEKLNNSIDEELLIMQFNIFPNPVKDKLTLQFKIEQPVNQSFGILNLTGKVVQSGELKAESNQTMLDVNLLTKGTYFLIINNQKIKFIKE